MVVNRRWTRSELLAALNMYCQLPFGRLHVSNPAIIQLAHAMERSPAALAMKLVNIASLDPKITSTGRSGLQNTSLKTARCGQRCKTTGSGSLLKLSKPLPGLAWERSLLMIKWRKTVSRMSVRIVR